MRSIPLQNTTLILFTANFPYGKAEHYIETELVYLSKSFRKVIIYCDPSCGGDARTVPLNVEILHYRYLPTFQEKAKAIMGIFNALFWKELFTMVIWYKLFPTKTRIASLLGSLYTAKKIFLLLQKNYFQTENTILYSYWNNDVAVGLAYYKRKYPFKTSISRAHGYDVYFERNATTMLPYREFIFKYLDSIFFVSNDGMKYTEKRISKWPSQKLSYLGSEPLPQPTIDKTEGNFRFISCSSVIPLKRVNLILESILSIEKEYTIHWTHIGDGPLLNQLRNNLAEVSTHHTIEFVGNKTNQDVLEIYKNQKFDLFINLSASEGLPFSIIEAFSAGIPAMATHVGGTKEILSDRVNGILVNPNPTVFEVKKALEEFLEYDDATREEIRKNAWKTWNEKFNAGINYPAFISEINKLFFENANRD